MRIVLFRFARTPSVLCSPSAPHIPIHLAVCCKLAEPRKAAAKRLKLRSAYGSLSPGEMPRIGPRTIRPSQGGKIPRQHPPEF